ncbi:uncharacterized protein LOC116256909 isoform X2 [Nymphaea colorata]|nr:uncharacterized protein LOC116256909 isoform X2 [Nymphaea colorata]
MGRKSGGLYINPKKFAAAQKPCMKETLAFLNCLALNQNNDDKCVRQKELLQTCMDAQSGKNSKRSWGSINYHLQRLGKQQLELGLRWWTWFKRVGSVNLNGPNLGCNRLGDLVDDFV